METFQFEKMTLLEIDRRVEYILKCDQMENLMCPSGFGDEGKNDRSVGILMFLVVQRTLLVEGYEL